MTSVELCRKSIRSLFSQHTSFMELELPQRGELTFTLIKHLAKQEYSARLNINVSTAEELSTPHSLEYRVIATFLHIIIFTLGVIGNVILILAVRRSKSLQTSTYCYLISLAWADLLVLFSAVPDAIHSHHYGYRWVSGQAGCSIMVFTNFLGINAGSLSILGFTIDRYIAVKKPVLATKCCSWQFSRKAVMGLWVFAVAYCSPWLALTQVKSYPGLSNYLVCDFRLSHKQYSYFFIADMILFYFVPLLVATVVFFILGLSLRRSISNFERAAQSADEPSTNEEVAESPPIEESETTSSQLTSGTKVGETVQQRQKRFTQLIKSRTQVFRTLVIIVIIFALTWLPFRGLLIFNSFTENPWINAWYMLFAKTCIYFNSAMNPFLYNLMSKRFRLAARATVFCQSTTKRC